MIACRDDYLRYLESDRIALGRKHRYGFADWLLDPIWTYLRVMRYLAYLVNVKCPSGESTITFEFFLDSGGSR